MNFLKKLVTNFRDRQRILINLTKGSAGQASLDLVENNPLSWEFSGFSQNGEDGIIQYLLSKAKDKNKYFVEIGSADGIDNNSAWLAIVQKYNGIMIEGDKELSTRAKIMVENYSLGLKVINLFVNIENIEPVFNEVRYNNPDLMSLDIDGNDYYIARILLDRGFRPKIFVVEYNSVFGPEKSITIPYSDNFSIQSAHSSQLYFGVSINCWKKLFKKHGYRFVTVDSKGVNAFFVQPDYFEKRFLDSISGLEYRENEFHLKKFNLGQSELFKLIEDMPYEIIN